ncbi:3-oxoacyl-[acyl-carrier-protein] reductase FabG [Marinomonas spartinae]|uniref:SDR family NAD(P)-dependent oxidoreductase n=1 Tax=Marinomonas spartinae TaxID=1792290 RepID=UPI0008090644|nr:SDR family oxidoreductase [Marinomonas spartinae]SBS40444.1 3-oxoacyl-[acyl-carrier-protein] reductase FabG [Marinomonas spartinae]
MSNRVVVVTGANGDIGRSLVESLLQNGYLVAACVRDSRTELFLPNNDNLKFFLCDFSLESSIKSCVDEIKKHYKEVYGLVNCIGVPHGSSFLMTKYADLNRVFTINCFSVLYFSQLLVRKMLKKRSGSIVNFASTAGILSDKGTLVYGASKAALIHSSKVMATELGDFGIRVNVIAPAIVESKMAGLMDEASVMALDKRAVLPGKIYPNEVAETVIFLLSDAAAKITKQVITIDRGITD